MERFSKALPRYSQNSAGLLIVRSLWSVLSLWSDLSLCGLLVGQGFPQDPLVGFSITSPKDNLKAHLARYRRIQISVVSMKSADNLNSFLVPSVPITEAKTVKSVIERVREKYAMLSAQSP